jgi:hypothetical protein
MPRWGGFSLMAQDKRLFLRVKNYLTKKILKEFTMLGIIIALIFLYLLIFEYPGGW